LNSVSNANKVTWYLGEYQYEEVVGGPSPKALAVSFISFGEGRIRPITPRNESNTYDALQLDGNLTLPNGKKGSIDYFISDHRTDVRMILTEEKQWSYTTASMETASSRNTVEEGLFSTQVNLSRAPKTEVPGWTANTSQYVSKLNNTRMVGPNQMLKVMAGDLMHANVQYYYQQVATNSSGSTVFGSVLSMLGSSITGSAVTSAATKAASSSIIANLNTGLPFSQVISPDITSSTGNLPKAYLNVVFFDERFNFVSESSTSVRVGAANVAANLALTQIKAPENGYCYVYISNESTVSVYFDNLQVRHDRGRIVEENHYYAYGLRINAISSKAYGGPANNYLYQGDFAELDEDLGWTDFMLRSYDAEIGRFLQNDPYDQFTSGYVGMGGDPVNNIDPSGGKVPGGIPCPGANITSNFSSVLSSVVSLIAPLKGGIETLVEMNRRASVGTATAKDIEWVNKLLNELKPIEKKEYGSYRHLKKLARAGSRLGGIIFFLFLPSDSNEGIDDTVDGKGGWKKAERELQEREANEDQIEEKYSHEIRYVTYRKYKFEPDGTLLVYSGRTSGIASLSAEEIVKKRDRQHELRNEWLTGYGEAFVDEEAVGSKRNSLAKWAIRGREQQLIDHHGGARSFPDNGTSGNRIRGVGRYNQKGRLYHNAANALFGEFHKYTGLL
jgi:RHS repeat-associated protein